YQPDTASRKTTSYPPQHHDRPVHDERPLKINPGVAHPCTLDNRAYISALAKMLATIAGEYDLVLLDCPPGNEPLQAAAAAAARYALVPLKTDLSNRKGVAAVAARMDSVVGLNPSLNLLGVVLVGTGTNSKQVHRVTRDHLIADFGTNEVLFPMPPSRKGAAHAGSFPG
ncbi:ParA family protein, partial [Pseudarthrobacter sp. YAF2]|uniref:ParA family protein n=1 Tax=Pseudarthrobacter sp. YAF2 TaxID=3233078 RepID=UPI003F9709AC